MKGKFTVPGDFDKTDPKFLTPLTEKLHPKFWTPLKENLTVEKS